LKGEWNNWKEKLRVQDFRGVQGVQWVARSFLSVSQRFSEFFFGEILDTHYPLNMGVQDPPGSFPDHFLDTSETSPIVKVYFHPYPRR
jgi:hypothetical protein